MHLSKEDGRRRVDDPRADTPWTATGHERPVFLDEHGRRRRWVLVGGALAGAASALWLAALLAGAVGFSTLPMAHTRFLKVRPHAVASVWAQRHDGPVDARDREPAVDALSGKFAVDTRRDEAVLRRATASVRHVVDRT
jgi:hypothetical protein